MQVPTLDLQLSRRSCSYHVEFTRPLYTPNVSGNLERANNASSPSFHILNACCPVLVAFPIFSEFSNARTRPSAPKKPPTPSTRITRRTLNTHFPVLAGISIRLGLLSGEPADSNVGDLDAYKWPRPGTHYAITFVILVNDERKRRLVKKVPVFEN